MDWLTNFYLACFIFGLVFTVVSVLWSADRPTNGFGEVRTWFSFNAFVIAVTWFGAAGFVLRVFDLTHWLVFPVAGLIGLFGYLMMREPNRRLYRTSAEMVADPVGEVARVVSPALDGQSGKIICSKDGIRHQLEARSLSSTTFREGSQVVIVRYEANIAFVDDLNKVLTEAGGDKWVTL